MEVRNIEETDPETSAVFPPNRISEFERTVKPAIARRRDEWIAMFGPETAPAKTNEAIERFVFPRCEPVAVSRPLALRRSARPASSLMATTRPSSMIAASRSIERSRIATTSNLQSRLGEGTAVTIRYHRHWNRPLRCPMLRYAIIFLVIAIIAAVFGFGGIAGEAVWIAKILFFVFIVLFVVSLITGRRPLR